MYLSSMAVLVFWNLEYVDSGSLSFQVSIEFCCNSYELSFTCEFSFFSQLSKHFSCYTYLMFYLGYAMGHLISHFVCLFSALLVSVWMYISLIWGSFVLHHWFGFFSLVYAYNLKIWYFHSVSKFMKILCLSLCLFPICFCCLIPLLYI